MKVLHTITTLHVGGAQAMLAKLVEGDTGRRIQQSVVSMIAPDAIGSRIEAQNIPVHTLGMREGMPSLRAALRLRRIMRCVEPDLVQGWMYHGALAGSLAAATLSERPPIIWNMRHSLADLSREKLLTRAVIKLSARASSAPAAIIYNSRVAAEQHARLGFRSDRAVVIPNGFDCNRFAPTAEARGALCQRFGIPREATIVGMVARYHPMKDPELLVKAVSRARAAGHDLHLLLVGRGFDRPPESVATIVRQLLPPDRVTLAAERQDVAEWLPGLDVLALPSAWGEGFANILGEAMASGVPCVATDVGDSGWIIGTNGRVVSPGDTEAFSMALISLVSLSDDARRQIGQGGRKRVIENFSLPKIVGEYHTLYDSVITEHRSRRSRLYVFTASHSRGETRFR